MPASAESLLPLRPVLVAPVHTTRPIRPGVLGGAGRGDKPGSRQGPRVSVRLSQKMEP